MRVHILAKELNVASKDIIAKCRAEGIDTVKNHMSTLSAGLHATIVEWFSESKEASALETAAPVDLKKVRAKAKKRKTTKTSKEPETSAAEAMADSAAVATPAQETAVAATAEAVDVRMAAAVASESKSEVKAKPHPSEGGVAVAEPPSAEAPPIPPPDDSHGTGDSTTGPSAPEAAPPSEAAEQDEDGSAATEEPQEPEPTPVAPAGPQHVPAPAKLQGPRVVRYEAPEHDYRPPHRAADRSRPGSSRTAAEAPQTPTDAPAEVSKGPDKAARKRARINPRRAATTLREAGEKFAEWRDQDLQERRERLAGATGRRIAHRRSTAKSGSHPGGAQSTGPVTAATVHEPIRMKEFCSSTGLSFMQLYKIIRDEHGLMPNINMILPTETAELLAIPFGLELNVIPAKTLLDDVVDEFENRERKKLETRPPVVTMLGHVDHGKTSLLDAIRKTHVASGEDGGITQHISSYHIKTTHGAVTFLDTPGHAAFTAMRARGAQLTDVVVLVIAADDGIMPQTVEAINHAKAAGVPIVVALNKIDLGLDNRLKIYGQLSEHGLTPSGDWGGEIDVIETSATKGQGVQDLVDHLAELSHLLELKADPTVPAAGTVIEAETKAGVGAVVQVLIQEGTLKVGAFVVCGNASGKVRAILNDRGERITKAKPSMPVEVWGLDDVPLASDRLFQLDRLQRAKEVAAEVSHARLQEGRQQSRKVATLQELLKQRDTDEVPELNVVIKGDVDGSVSALKSALSSLPTDEVRLAIRHAGVGQVNDSDILLAATCNGIIIAFRVDTSTGARRLCDQHGVDVRQYRVIYDACDDIKRALEGLLSPLETVESRATAEVREVFRLSRKGGVIAGSYVSSGNLVRDHLVKIVRDGVVVRENAKIGSLRRFKEDAKEVRTGMECGIRIENFDDVHVGDVIESYEIIKTARTL